MLLAFEAQITSFTRDGRVTCQPLSKAPPARNGSYKLVSENERLSKHRIPDATFDEPMSIRAAQPDGGYLQQNLSYVRSGLRLIVYANVARRVQLQHSHDSAYLLSIGGSLRWP